jgi:hypothetical protein
MQTPHLSDYLTRSPEVNQSYAADLVFGKVELLRHGLTGRYLTCLHRVAAEMCIATEV